MTFSSPLAWHIAIAAAWLSIVFILAEGLHRFSDLPPEATRKIVHIGTGPVILLAWWLQIPAWVAIVAAIAAGSVALTSYWLPLLPGIESIGRRSFGTFFYAVSMGAAIAWFWPRGMPQYAAIGILAMSFGDGLAAVVGRAWGRHRYSVWGIEKSWEGTATMFAVSWLAIAAILFATGETGGSILAIATVTALWATALETVSKWGIDNLTVPLGTAAVAFWLSQL